MVVFMSTAEHIVEKQKLIKLESLQNKGCRTETNEVLYQTEENKMAQSTNNSKVCFSCGKQGHYARECRSKLTCKYC